jgi:hypothetical protein
LCGFGSTHWEATMTRLTEVVMDEQRTAPAYEPPVYEPPVLVELGEFGEDTLGFGQDFTDAFALQTQ